MLSYKVTLHRRIVYQTTLTLHNSTLKYEGMSAINVGQHVSQTKISPQHLPITTQFEHVGHRIVSQCIRVVRTAVC